MSCVWFILLKVLRLLFHLLFNGIGHHPHTDQHRLQCPNQAKDLVFRFSEINSSLLAAAMEIGMIHSTERQEQPRDVLAATQVILLKFF